MTEKKIDLNTKGFSLLQWEMKVLSKLKNYLMRMMDSRGGKKKFYIQSFWTARTISFRTSGVYLILYLFPCQVPMVKLSPCYHDCDLYIMLVLFPSLVLFGRWGRGHKMLCKYCWLFIIGPWRCMFTAWSEMNCGQGTPRKVKTTEIDSKLICSTSSIRKSEHLYNTGTNRSWQQAWDKCKCFDATAQWIAALGGVYYSCLAYRDSVVCTLYYWFAFSKHE